MRWLCLLLCLTLLSCAASKKQSYQSQLRTKIGTAHLRNKNYPLAFKELLEAVRLDPNNALAHNNLGLSYIARKMYAEAKEHFQQAIALKSDYTDAKNNLGVVYTETKEYNRAVEVLKEAAEDLTYPYPEKLLSNLGIAYFKTGDYQLAKVKLAQALDTNRKYCPSLSFYGQSLFHLEEYDSAARSLDQTIALCKQSPIDAVHYYAGLSYYKIGQYEKARARLLELMNYYPESPFASQAKESLSLMEF